MRRAPASFAWRSLTRSWRRFTGYCGDKFRWPDEDLTEPATDLADFTLRVSPTQTIDAVPEDPDDNRVLECAVAAASRYIVTGDAARYRGIQIIRVADFMALINPR